jgi:hypothetical protein
MVVLVILTCQESRKALPIREKVKVLNLRKTSYAKVAKISGELLLLTAHWAKFVTYTLS